MRELIYNGLKLKIEIGKYPNKRIALFLMESGEPYADITVNLPDEPTTEKTAFIDTNNLETDLYQALQDAKVISKQPVNYGFSGFCSYPLHEILI